MLVRDLHPLAMQLTAEEFASRVGSFVFMQKPLNELYAQISRRLGPGQTVHMAHRNRLGDEGLALAQQFDGLWVVALPAGGEAPQVTLGRGDTCDVVIHEPSVSGRHAAARWSPESNGWVLFDLESRNGTFVNARRIDGYAVAIADGDMVSFGDAQFLFMRGESLREQILSSLKYRR